MCGASIEFELLAAFEEFLHTPNLRSYLCCAFVPRSHDATEVAELRKYSYMKNSGRPRITVKHRLELMVESID